MQNGQLSINSEKIGAAVNEISVLIADIDTRNKALINLLDEKYQQTNRKFGLMNTLKTRIEQEATNIQNTIEATESIKESIRKYTEMAEEASDDEWARRGM